MVQTGKSKQHLAQSYGQHVLDTFWKCKYYVIVTEMPNSILLLLSLTVPLCPLASHQKSTLKGMKSSLTLFLHQFVIFLFSKRIFIKTLLLLKLIECYAHLNRRFPSQQSEEMTSPVISQLTVFHSSRVHVMVCYFSLIVSVIKHVSCY